MLTHDEISRVLAHYDVGELRSVRAAGRGMINETAFIETSVGRFVIRRNRRVFNRLHFAIGCSIGFASAVSRRHVSCRPAMARRWLSLMTESTS